MRFGVSDAEDLRPCLIVTGLKRKMGRVVSGLLGEHEVKNSRPTNIPSSERCAQPE